MGRTNLDKRRRIPQYMASSQGAQITRIYCTLLDTVEYDYNRSCNPDNTYLMAARFIVVTIWTIQGWLTGSVGLQLQKYNEQETDHHVLKIENIQNTLMQVGKTFASLKWQSTVWRKTIEIGLK